MVRSGSPEVFVLQPVSVWLCTRSPQTSSATAGGTAEQFEVSFRGGESGGKNGSAASFVFILLHPLVSFQAESLLVRRKVWRGNECRRTQRRKRGRRGRQRGRQADKPQQEAAHTRTHTHARAVCLCVRAPKRERLHD